MAKLKFGSAEWTQALHNEVEHQPSVRGSRQNWEGEFYFIVEPDGPITQTVHMYMISGTAKSREAKLVQDPQEKNPALSCPASTANGTVVLAKLDPIQAPDDRTTETQSNMTMVMKKSNRARKMSAPAPASRRIRM